MCTIVRIIIIDIIEVKCHIYISPFDRLRGDRGGARLGLALLGIAVAAFFAIDGGGGGVRACCAGDGLASLNWSPLLTRWSSTASAVTAEFSFWRLGSES